jgi:hypothetical protein
MQSVPIATFIKSSNPAQRFSSGTSVSSINKTDRHSFSFTLTEAAERPTEAAQRPAVATERPTEFYKVDSSSEHIELLSALVPDSSTKEMDDILEM